MPRAPRNPGVGKRPFNGPARGAGAGQWGGDAKGASTSRITPENARALLALRDDPEAKAAKDELTARMLSVLVDVAETDQSGAARANAADKALDRLLGKARQRMELTMRDVPAEDMTDDELAAIARRGGAGAVGAPEG